MKDVDNASRSRVIVFVNSCVAVKEITGVVGPFDESYTFQSTG